jgi:hypothetical protein
VNRPRPGLTLAAGVVIWVALITALHATINGRSHAARVAEARTLSVGGLPVT